MRVKRRNKQFALTDFILAMISIKNQKHKKSLEHFINLDLLNFLKHIKELKKKIYKKFIFRFKILKRSK